MERKPDIGEEPKRKKRQMEEPQVVEIARVGGELLEDVIDDFDRPLTAEEEL